MSATKIFLTLLLMSGLNTTFVEAQVDSTILATKTFTLQEILSIALEHNPLISEGQGLVEQKEGTAQTASAYPNPTISVQSGRGSIRDPSMNTSITERYVTLSQPLEWPGTRSAQQQAAQASVQSAQAGLAETKLNVTAQIKKGFFDLLFSERELELARENDKTVKKLNQAVQARVKAGEAPPFEAIKIKVESLKIQKELTRSKGAVQSAKAALNSLTAGELSDDFSIRGTFQTLSNALDITVLSRQALSTHPRMLKGQKRVEEAKERHRRELHARVPNVTLSGSYQRDIGREAFVGGLSVPIPLWSQRQGEIAKAKGMMRQEEAILLRTRTGLHKGITQEVQKANSASAQIATYEDGLLEQAKEALRIAQVSFKYGETSLLEVLDAQRVMRETQLEYTRAKHELSVSLTELERLTGTMEPSYR